MKRRLALIIYLFFVCGRVYASDDLAIQTIAYEASGETLEGQIAVANTIRTRMKERRQTSKQVVLAPYQFSCWHPTTQAPTQRRKLTKKDIANATIAWEKSRVWEYNHYATYKSKPYWIKSAKKKKQIGNHIFYEL